MESHKYECTLCNQGFSRAFNLKRHYETFHNRYVEEETSDIDEEETVSDSNMSAGEDEGSSSESNMSDGEDEGSSSESNSEDEGSNSESKDMEMSNDGLSKSEWTIYSQNYADLMMSVYTRVAKDGETADDDIMTNAKKEFRKVLSDHLITFLGLQRDETYDYLFDKIRSLINKGIESLPLALHERRI